MNNPNEDFKNNLEHFLKSGSTLAGAAVGVALTPLDPTGGYLANSTAILLPEVINPILERLIKRFLPQREEARIGCVLSVAKEKIQHKIECDETMRDDDFFLIDNSSSYALQIFEGVLLFAQDTFEEKKLEYLGNFFADICFDKDVDSYQANLLLRMINNLSYTQLCLLKIFSIYEPTYSSKYNR